MIQCEKVPKMHADQKSFNKSTEKLFLGVLICWFNFNLSLLNRSNNNKFQPDPLDDSIENSPIFPSSNVGSKFGSNRPKSAPAPAHTTSLDQDIGSLDANANNDSPQNQDLFNNNNLSKKTNDDELDLGFMPSFLEQGREPRSRR